LCGRDRQIPTIAGQRGKKTYGEQPDGVDSIPIVLSVTHFVELADLMEEISRWTRCFFERLKLSEAKGEFRKG
jgi:hypothetical protein